MKELTTFIAFLSDSLSYISNYSYANWLTAFSDATYFSFAADRYYRDALLAGYTDIDLWAQSVPDPAIQYHTQDIPATCADAYYRAAELARGSGAIRSRMPFHRPLFGGIGPSAHVTPAQAVVRQRFKYAIDRFNTLIQDYRGSIYDRSLFTGRWYFNFFLSEEFALIKRIETISVSWDGDFQQAFPFTDAFNPARTLIVSPDHLFDYFRSTSIPFPLRCQFLTCATVLYAALYDFTNGWNFYFNITLIEFY